MTSTESCSTCGTQIPIDDTDGLCPRCLLKQGMDTDAVNSALDATIVPASSGAAPKGQTPGLAVGDYELLEEVARGGMGVVYKARHTKLNRVAAIKMILSGQFSSQDEIKRFHIEAEAAAQLDHPGIVPVYDIGEQDGQAFFAMKYIEGESLAERMGEFRDDPRPGIRLLQTVADAVHHAHQRGILHRDLKPANILLDENSQPLITDLGLAKSTAGDSKLTKTGAIVGTPAYMPPEQAGGEQSVTTAVDIYSLGAILYEMLTGRPPHACETPMATVMSVLNETPPSPGQINRNVDRELELICLKCIERNPEERYSSAAALASDLTAWLAGKPISLKPPTLSSLAAQWVKQNRRIVYAALPLFLAVAFIGPVLAIVFGPMSSMSDVYQHFPEGQRPWFFTFVNMPKSLVMGLLVGLVFVIWPATGLCNALVARPDSVKKSIRAGVIGWLVCSFVVAIALGWLFILAATSNHSDKYLRTVAEAVWTPDGTSREEALEAANSLYKGLDAVPENKRADILAQRVFTEAMAQAIDFLGLIGVFSMLVAAPVIYGTVIAHILLRRETSFWLTLLRYALTWAAVTVIALNIWAYLVGYLNDRLETENGRNHLTAISVSCVIVFLTVRRWKKPAALSTP